MTILPRRGGLATLLHNPGAGEGDHQRNALERLLQAQGFTVTATSTKAPNVAEVLALPADLYVLAGGDGSVGKMLRRLPDRSAPVAIIPLGTANNTATSLGLIGDPEVLMANLRDAAVRPFDIGCTAGPFGRSDVVEAVGLGALASTMALEPVGTKEENMANGRRAFSEALDTTEPRELRLILDGTAHCDAWLAVEVLNHGHAGPRLPLLPKVDLGDGMLDVLALTEAHRKPMQAWLKSDMKRRPPGLVLRARRVRFDWDGALPLRIDDKLQAPPADPSPITITARSRTFDILVPRDSGGHHG